MFTCGGLASSSAASAQTAHGSEPPFDDCSVAVRVDAGPRWKHAIRRQTLLLRFERVRNVLLVGVHSKDVGARVVRAQILDKQRKKACSNAGQLAERVRILPSASNSVLVLK